MPPARKANGRVATPAAAASQENVRHQCSKTARNRNLRHLLAAHVDARVDTLLEALAPDDREA
jgi:hypothetical protein